MPVKKKKCKRGKGLALSGGRRKKRRSKSTNPWILHVQNYRRMHPHLSYTEALKKARATY